MIVWALMVPLGREDHDFEGHSLHSFQFSSVGFVEGGSDPYDNAVEHDAADYRGVDPSAASFKEGYGNFTVAVVIRQ